MTLHTLELVVRDRFGLDIEALGPSVFPKAVETRMTAVAAHSIESYLAILNRSVGELTALAAEIVVPESWFFRGGWELFQTLALFVKERAQRLPSSSPVRILSIPCSTGEEPYSLAIALHEWGIPAASYEIQGIDLSRAHIARAESAVYRSFAFREPFPKRETFFLPDCDRWILRPALRQTVKFRTGNILDFSTQLRQPSFDLIFSRNIFIYLTADARQRAMAKLDDLLIPDGWLCLSPAEANRLVPGKFEAQGHPKFGLYRRIPSTTPKPSLVLQVHQAPVHSYPPLFNLVANAATDRSPRVDRPGFTTERPTSPPNTVAMATNEWITAIRELANTGQLADAKLQCGELLVVAPGSAESQALWGVLCQAEGRTEEAENAFRRALYLDHNHRESIQFLILLATARRAQNEVATLRRRLAQLEQGDAK